MATPFVLLGLWKPSGIACVFSYQRRWMRKQEQGSTSCRVVTYRSGLGPFLFGCRVRVEVVDCYARLFALLDNLPLRVIGGDGAVWVLGSLDGTLLRLLVLERDFGLNKLAADA